MGRLIIDGKSVFEVDEECIRSRNVPTECGIEKYFMEDETHKQKLNVEKEDR